MLTKNQYKWIVGQLTVTLGSHLADHGFDSTPTVIDLDGLNKTIWRRDLAWKLDVLEFHHGAECCGSVGLQLVGEFPIPDVSTGDNVHLDGCSVDYLAGKRDVGYNVPLFFSGVLLGWRTARCGRRMLRDVDKALAWFDKLDTPTKCLAHLDTGLSRWGDTEGPDVQRMREYLAGLANEKKSS